MALHLKVVFLSFPCVTAQIHLFMLILVYIRVVFLFSSVNFSFSTDLVLLLLLFYYICGHAAVTTYIWNCPKRRHNIKIFMRPRCPRDQAWRETFPDFLELKVLLKTKSWLIDWLIDSKTSHSGESLTEAISALSLRTAVLPVVVLLAVDAAVLAEAGELRLQVQFALAALQTSHVPLLVNGQQVVAVRDLPAATGAQGDPLARHARHRLRVSTELLGGEHVQGFCTAPWHSDTEHEKHTGLFKTEGWTGFNVRL